MRAMQLCGMSCIFFLLGYPVAHAQASNDSLYAFLIQDFFGSHPGPYLELAGLPTFIREKEAWRDSLSEKRIRFWDIEIGYTPTEEGLTSRSLRLPYTLELPLLEEDTLVFRDTLTRKELKHVFRESSPALQGEPPFRWERWGRPLVWGSAGIMLTTLLFYLRSP